MTINGSSSSQNQTTLKQVARVGVIVLLLGVLLGGGAIPTPVEASCSDDFAECDGSLAPLSDSLSALNLLAWTVLRLGGLIVLMGGIVLFVSSRVGVGTKKQATGAIIAGSFMLFLYFAKNALFGIIDFIVSG